MHCILTGFDPFGGGEVNPSQQAIERVSDQLQSPNSNETIRLSKIVLSTCCDEAWSLLRKEVAAIGDDSRFALILCGMAETRERIGLERFALNVRTYRLADNRGHQWDEEHIDAAGPEAIRTALPLKSLQKELTDSGYHMEISNHAGSFVCNETYYRALQKWQEDKRCAGVLFVHFPPAARYAATATMPEDADVIQIYSHALQDLVRAINWA